MDEAEKLDLVVVLSISLFLRNIIIKNTKLKAIVLITKWRIIIFKSHEKIYINKIDKNINGENIASILCEGKMI